MLSSSASELESSYDVVVIGSGYGGSIAASRAARAGQKVCLLEKGKEWKPGDFPETELSAIGELQMTIHDKKTIKGMSHESSDLPLPLKVTVQIIVNFEILVLESYTNQNDKETYVQIKHRANLSLLHFDQDSLFWGSITLRTSPLCIRLPVVFSRFFFFS